MDSPAGGRHGPPGQAPRATVLGSLTVPGKPEQVARLRQFVGEALATAALPGVDFDAATLLTSELAANAIMHTDSGKPGGTVTVVARRLPEGLLVEVADQGSASRPVVKGDSLATGGQGLHLVEQIAAQWGYLRSEQGSTVWFFLAASAVTAGQPPPPQPAAAAASTPAQITARSSSLVT